MLFHVDMIYLAKQGKRDVEKSFALILMKTVNQIKPRTGFLKFYDKTKKLSRCFASFSLGPEQFTHGIYITVLICPTYVKKS